MGRVFLINVGANISNRSIARSPIFRDGSFIYVSFSVDPVRNPTRKNYREYPPLTRPYVHGNYLYTHDDPDWIGLTYGDDCRTSRAAALRSVQEGDILVFWTLLWRNTGQGWADFTGDYNWYLIGALRVAGILEGGQQPQDAKPPFIERATRNVHFTGGRLFPGNRVFIGDERYSACFAKAVDMGAREETGLLYTTIQQASGAALQLHGPVKWYTSLRSCRVVWNLDRLDDLAKARIARDRIWDITGYDLLAK